MEEMYVPKELVTSRAKSIRARRNTHPYNVGGHVAPLKHSLEPNKIVELTG